MIQNVPRGTRIIGMRFSEPMVQALDRDLKDQTRRPLTPGNCVLTRGQFDQLDFESGRPDGLAPVSSLRCRLTTEAGDRRSVTVSPRIRPSNALWARRGQAGPGARKVNARFLLWVTSASAVRLQDICEYDALREGVLIFCPPGIHNPGGPLDDMLAAAYDFQLQQLGKKYAARWRAGVVHQDVMAHLGRATARDCYALLWESINGPGSWSANPWVWRYGFRKVAAVGAVADQAAGAESALPPAGL